MCEEVKNRGVSVNILNLFLSKLLVYNFEKKQGHPSLDFLPHDVILKLEGAESIEYIFAVLGDLFSYMNYSIFQSISQHFCRDSTDEALQYPKYFRNYIGKLNVKELIKFNPKLAKYCPEGSSELVIKLDVVHTTKISEIVNIKSCIAKNLKLNPFLLRIVNIEEGCVKVTVLLPTHVAEVLFHRDTTFTAHQIETFKDLSVMWLQCYGYTFDVKDDYLPVTSLPVSHAHALVSMNIIICTEKVNFLTFLC